MTTNIATSNNYNILSEVATKAHHFMSGLPALMLYAIFHRDELDYSVLGETAANIDRFMSALPAVAFYYLQDGMSYYCGENSLFLSPETGL